MWRSNRFRYNVVGVLLFSLIVGGWLFVGRLSLFQTSSYISLFGLDWPKKLYQGNVLWLSEGAGVKQDFMAKYPGLYKISIFLISRESLEHDVELTFHLRETCDSQDDIRRVVKIISTSDVDGDTFYPFTFTPIDESTNRRFCFILDAILLKSKENVLGVRASEVDVYSEGQAFYQAPPEEVGPVVAGIEIADQSSQFNHKVFLPIIQKNPSLKDNFDVGFQLHYNGRPLETLHALLIRLTEHKPYFWGNPGFYILLFIVYVSGLFLLIRIGE